MNKGLFQKLLPHLIAVVIFFVVAVLFCGPAFQGQVLQQHDIVGVKGMTKSIYEHYEQYGHYPLWNTHMFSGMPNYQILIKGPSVLVNITNIITLGLPEPANFFFLAAVCFYILCLAFRINPYIGIFGALSFALATYNPVILSAGHITKMLAIAYAPGLLAGLIWLYEKRYWLGIGMTTFFAAAEIAANHPQINYYLFIVIVFMTISYLIIWIKQQQYKHTAIALSLALLGAVIGVGTAAVTLFTTFEYTKYTMRGGKSIENTGSTIVEKKTTGLDKDYAFSYSYGIEETLTLLMPNAFGGSSSQTFEEDSKLVEELTSNNVPEASAVQLASSLPKYWGGIELGTSGPYYSGVLCVLLFIIGLVVVTKKHRWWILGAVVFTVFMAWGKYFLSFNNLLYNYLPYYNKFRAPSMSLVASQWLIPLMAALTLQTLLFKEAQSRLSKETLNKILYALGGLIVLIGLVYLMNDYSASIDDQIMAAYSSQQGGGDTASMIISSLKAARQSMLGNGLLRVILFSLIVLGLIYLWNKKSISALTAIIVFIAINTIDLFAVGKNYLNENNYIDADSYITYNFKPTQADETILQDKNPHFRVLNLAPDRFNESRTSYYHRSVGGYHAAKLRVYQDLIENQLSKPELNMPVLNMLDTKYFLFPDQQGNVSVQKNDSALGAAWFVQQVQPVNGPVAEMKALDNFNPEQTAFVDVANQKVNITQPQYNPAASIQLQYYNNDTIRYVTNATTPQFAVFSEVYYPAGWNAYVDGKQTDYLKVNYALRGMAVPPGQHTIEFRFEPKVYYTSYTIGTVSTILMYILFLLGLFMSYRKKEVSENNYNPAIS